MNRETAGNNDSSTSRLVDSVDQMMRWPFQMTGATWDLMMKGVESVTGQRASGNRSDMRSTTNWSSTSTSADRSSDTSGPSWTATLTGQADQDLSGDDLKYVMWSIVFTKPGLECVLEPQHEELVNYSADGSSYAAVKIAKFLERARHGHANKPESWGETYPVESKTAERRTESITVTPGSISDTTVSSSASAKRSTDKGWRIPPEDHKYITFLYRVDRRLPKQDVEVTRVERLTIERGGTTKVI